MNIRKNMLGMTVAFLGMAALGAVMVLFCFTDLQIPKTVYAAAWFGCLYAMTRAEAKIYR